MPEARPLLLNSMQCLEVLPSLRDIPIPSLSSGSSPAELQRTREVGTFRACHTGKYEFHGEERRHR